MFYVMLSPAIMSGAALCLIAGVGIYENIQIRREKETAKKALFHPSVARLQDAPEQLIIVSAMPNTATSHF
jgi:hypothetical protein